MGLGFLKGDYRSEVGDGAGEEDVLRWATGHLFVAGGGGFAGLERFDLLAIHIAGDDDPAGQLLGGQIEVLRYGSDGSVRGAGVADQFEDFVVVEGLEYFIPALRVAGAGVVFDGGDQA